MANLSYTAAEIDERLAKTDDIGDLADLQTTDKDSLVDAVNELFTFVSDGKSVVAAAITDKGVPTAATDTFADMAQNIEDITPVLQTKSVSPTESAQTVTPDVGYDGLEEVNVAAIPSNYVGSGVTTKAAATLHPSASDQEIASGTYLTGKQTVKGVQLTNLTAENIKKDVVVKVGDSTDDDCVTSVTGTYEGGGGTSPWTLIAEEDVTISTTSTTATTAATIECGSSAFAADKIVWVHIRDKAGKRAEYFYGSDSFFINVAAKNNTNTFSNPAGAILRYSNNIYQIYIGSYGVYGYSINSSGQLVIRQRYNGTYSATINGTYNIKVYTLDLPTGTTLFDA